MSVPASRPCATPTIACANTPNARVVTPYAQTLLDAATAIGVSKSALLAPFGWQELPGESISVDAYLSLFDHAASLSGHPLFGWWLGSQVKPTTYGVNGILLLACNNLGEALEQVLRFECLVHDLGRSTLERHGDTAIYRWRNDHPNHPRAGMVAESVFTGIKTCAEWLAGQALQPTNLRFCHAAPANAEAYQSLVGAPVSFSSPENAVTFPSRLLDLPIPQANNSLFPLLKAHAEQLLSARHPKEADLLTRVRQAMIDRMGEDEITLKGVAAHLQCSTRTLQRRLAEAGETFQGLLDGTRCELACHYLQVTEQPVADIAFLIGFQEPSSFNHAFKGWMGVTPSQFRLQRGHGARAGQ